MTRFTHKKDCMCWRMLNSRANHTAGASSCRNLRLDILQG